MKIRLKLRRQPRRAVEEFHKICMSTPHTECALRGAIEELVGLKHPASVFGEYTYRRIIKRYTILRFSRTAPWGFCNLPLSVWEASEAAAWPTMAAAVIILEGR